MTADIVAIRPALRSGPWPRLGVHKTGPYTWLVPSRSQPGDYHTVEWHYNETDRRYFTCSCPAGGHNRTAMSGRLGYQRPCRHVNQAAVAEQADGLPARPAGRAGDLTRFVD